MSQIDFTDFMQVFETMVSDMLEDPEMGSDMPATLKRVEQVLRYNVPPKVEYGGFLVPKAYAEICGQVELTDEQINLSYKLGWCYRIIQCFLTLLDDYMDNDKERFGRPNWYYANGQKRIVINDMVLVEQITRWYLLKYFGHLPVHAALVAYFDKIVLDFVMGQSMSHTSTSREDPDMSGFTMENYKTCIRYSNMRFSILGSLHLAMILAGIGKGDPIWNRVENICVDITYCWAARDDLMDSFGENQLNKTIHTDIKLGTYTWLVVRAKEVCGEDEWRRLKQNYGRDDPVSVSIVKGIYVERGIPEMCRSYAKSLSDKVREDGQRLLEDGYNIGRIVLRVLELYENIDE